MGKFRKYMSKILIGMEVKLNITLFNIHYTPKHKNTENVSTCILMSDYSLWHELKCSIIINSFAKY